jgi:MT-A70
VRRVALARHICNFDRALRITQFPQSTIKESYIRAKISSEKVPCMTFRPVGPERWPSGKTGETIGLGPPYSYRQSLAGRARPEYAVMSQKQLLALPVADWAERDAHIYVWAPNNCLPEALELMEACGFSFTTVLTWIKPPRDPTVSVWRL